MYSSIIVIEDFYDHPLKVRKAALSGDFPPVTGVRTFPGRNSRQKLVPPGLDRMISHIVGEPVVHADNKESYHGQFRLTLAGEESRYMVHVDPSTLYWVGVIYLSLPEHCQGGTNLFRHRDLGSDRTPLDEAELRAIGVDSVAALLKRDGNSPEKWEKVMTLPMRFNRLVLYRPWLWHSAEAGFGDRDDNARLIQMVAFRRAPAAEARPGAGP